jgi:putative transposase
LHDRGHGVDDSQDTGAFATRERVLRTRIGTIRRERLDWMIPCNEHLRRVLGQWVAHYNRGRPHTSLGPGIPDAPELAPAPTGHCIRDSHRVVATPILGGLHHEYRLESRAA